MSRSEMPRSSSICDTRFARSLIGAASEAARGAEREGRAAECRASRRSLPAHLPRLERTVDIESLTCPCCSGSLHPMGEDAAERLDGAPPTFRGSVAPAQRAGREPSGVSNRPNIRRRAHGRST